MLQIRNLQGLDEKSEALLATIGITTVEQFMATDPFIMYKKLVQGESSVSLNLIYAMIGAQENMSWQQVAAERKTAVLMRLDDLGIAP